jgi:hypothetical protein
VCGCVMCNVSLCDDTQRVVCVIYDVIRCMMFGVCPERQRNVSCSLLCDDT